MSIKIREGVKLQEYLDTYNYTREDLEIANPGLGEELVEGQVLHLPSTQELNEYYAEQELSLMPPKLDFKKEYARAFPRRVTQEIPVPEVEGVRKLKEEQEQFSEDLVSLPENPTENWLNHLKDREGVRRDVYLDSRGKPTVGIGHLVQDVDQLREGDVISDDQVNSYLKEDSKLAWEAATKQARQLGRTDTDFIEALASVNYQLGTNWNQIHKNTWAKMVAGDWGGASKEAANSLWHSQTPIRVMDFQHALTKESS